MPGFTRLALSTIFFVFPCQSFSQQTAVPVSAKPLSPEALLSLRHLSALEFSPDNTHVAFVVAEPAKADKRSSHIWLFDVSNGSVRQLTYSEKSETSPKWSPDGKFLAFLSSRDANQQIYLLSMSGGEPAPLTKGKRNITRFVWSHDGKARTLAKVVSRRQISGLSFESRRQSANLSALHERRRTRASHKRQTHYHPLRLVTRWKSHRLPRSRSQIRRGRKKGKGQRRRAHSRKGQKTRPPLASHSRRQVGARSHAGQIRSFRRRVVSRWRASRRNRHRSSRVRPEHRTHFSRSNLRLCSRLRHEAASRSPRPVWRYQGISFRRHDQLHRFSRRRSQSS